MITPEYARQKFEQGLGYEAYLSTGTADQRAAWARFEASVELRPEQHHLVNNFVRQINVLALSGTWCGDCVQQVPMLAKIAESNKDRIRLRLVDRDEHMDLSNQVKICGGNRVPTVLFLNEDFEFVALSGDKSLSRLRAAARKQLGAACPLPGAPVDEHERAATLQDWVNDFERVHLTLRLSAKLRQRHGD
jgi:thioredoxin-like negative regulator of GroEL